MNKPMDIVCDNDAEFDKVVAILESKGIHKWDSPAKAPYKDMVRVFSDGSYAPHWSAFAGSVLDSTVISASEFITQNT